MNHPVQRATAATETRPTGDILVRLRRIEGQVRGLQHMLERGDPCREMLTQIAAARAALAAVGLRLVDCEVRQATLAAAGGDAATAERAAAPVVAAVELLLAR